MKEMYIRSGEKYMNAGMLGMLNCFPCPVYIIGMSTSQSANRGAAYLPSNKAYRFKVTGRTGREASLNDINTELLQMPSYLQLFLNIECSAGGLFSVSPLQMSLRWPAP